MERGWLDTVQLLGLDIALLVVIVLAALSAVTARLTLDRAESAESAASRHPEASPTAEWLDRLLSRDPERQPRHSGSRQDEHGPQPARRVA